MDEKSHKNRRILLVIPTITSYYTFLHELVSELRKRGWDTHLAFQIKAIDGFDCYVEAVAATTHFVNTARGASTILYDGEGKDWLVRT